MWGYLVRKVYAEGKQYDTADELICALRQKWAEMPQAYIRKLFDSMNRRCAAVLEKGGNVKV